MFSPVHGLFYAWPPAARGAGNESTPALVAARDAMQRLLRLTTLLFLVSALVGCDHVTKYVAKSELQGGNGLTVLPGWFGLVYTENRDVGFNLLSWLPDPPRQIVLMVVGFAASAALLFTLARRRTASRWHLGALCLVLAGALGNTLDRGLRGYVVDFLHVQHWPVFNLADVYVTLGVIAMFLLARNERAKASQIVR